ncbi:hypothetical protein V6N13_093541 [Hibiscus sabdariffa]|uniref:Uncharacterized protein n=2 Tax=Hibiscus sabdariffa TaxID=183260 RepID=A0ABR2BRA0_9ROSI
MINTEPNISPAPIKALRTVPDPFKDQALYNFLPRGHKMWLKLCSMQGPAAAAFWARLTFSTARWGPRADAESTTEPSRLVRNGSEIDGARPHGESNNSGFVHPMVSGEPTKP